MRTFAMRYFVAFLAFAIAFLATAVEAQDWDAVQNVLGRKGEVEEGILRVNFPRTDLEVTIGDIPVSAGLALTSKYGFWPVEDGEVRMMGDTIVREDELADVLEEIYRQGLKVTALHNHLVGEEPRIFFTHISWQGSVVTLAHKVKAELAQTATPMGEVPKEKETTPVDWSSVIDILGKLAEKEGNLIEYIFPRADRLSMMGMEMPSTEALETAPAVKFQMLDDGRVVTYGEMVLRPVEVDPVFRTFTKHGITMTALHNHIPRLFFMHWWAVGKPTELAQGIQTILDELNIRETNAQ